MTTDRSWLYFALGSAFFAGLTAVLGKLGVVGMPSNTATLIRTGVVFILAAALVALRSEWPTGAQLTGRGIVALLLSGLATGASWLCYYRALQLAPASKVAPIDKLSVAVAIILGVTFLGESASPRLLAGGALIVAGSLIIASS